MSFNSESGLMDSIITRFRDDYFIRDLGAHGLFCIPNFVVTVAAGKLRIQLLSHVSEADKAKIMERLADLPYEFLPERLTLEEIERRKRQPGR